MVLRQVAAATAIVDMRQFVTVSRRYLTEATAKQPKIDFDTHFHGQKSQLQDFRTFKRTVCHENINNFVILREFLQLRPDKGYAQLLMPSMFFIMPNETKAAEAQITKNHKVLDTSLSILRHTVQSKSTRGNSVVQASRCADTNNKNSKEYS